MILRVGSKGETVSSVQSMLKFLGYRGVSDPFNEQDGDLEGSSLRPQRLLIDGFFGTHTQAAVIQFQENEGLNADGIVGPITMLALEQAYARQQTDLASPGIDAVMGDPDRIPLVRVTADKYGEGYGAFTLRADVADAYQKVYDEVHAAGGLLTSSGGIRNLNANVSASRSAMSFHYLGRALDLFIYSGMVDPGTDPYVVERLEPLTYNVWARCSRENIDAAVLPDERQIDNAVSNGDRVNGQSVTGNFLDLTGLFKEHGFHSIRARRSFEQGGSYLGAEFWHFQYEEGLIPHVSTFGGELLRVYSEETLEETPPWRYRHRVYRESWAVK